MFVFRVYSEMAEHVSLIKVIVSGGLNDISNKNILLKSTLLHFDGTELTSFGASLAQTTTVVYEQAIS